MAPVDLSRNKDSMLKVHKEVSDQSSPTNWALFGYEGQTDVLKFVEKGDGGISEFLDELNSGRIMYAYLKILDPNTNLSKFVFVNWQPEGVPENRKGACASHVRDVENFFRGAHVTINARSEDDLDEDLIKTKVSKASGANYSFHKEQKQAMPEITPVGSVYQKVKPQIEIKPDIREKFWEQTQKEEQNRINVERQQKAAEKEKLDKEIKERELSSAKAREQKESERVKAIRSIKEAESAANTKSQDNSKWNLESDVKQSKHSADTQREAILDQIEREARADKLRQERTDDPEDARREEEERAKRSDHIRKERAAEAKNLVSGRAAEAKAMFEQKPTSQFDQESKGPAPSRKLKSSFLDEQNNAPAEPVGRKQPIKLPGREENQENISPSSPPAVRQPASPPAAKQPASPPARQPVASPPRQPEPEPEPEEEEEELYDDGGSTRQMAFNKAADPSPVSSPAVRPSGGDGGQPVARNLLAEGLPKRPPGSDDEEEDQDWDDSAPAKIVATNVPVSPAAELPSSPVRAAEPQQQKSGSGTSARALYDYQAAEDNEITFDPDDLILDIEMIDEGWWIGTAPDGSRGMFPANYVEIIQ